MKRKIIWISLKLIFILKNNKNICKNERRMIITFISMEQNYPATEFDYFFPFIYCEAMYVRSFSNEKL